MKFCNNSIIKLFCAFYNIKIAVKYLMIFQNLIFSTVKVYTNINNFYEKIALNLYKNAERSDFFILN